jgi:hypothetical protein
MAKRKTKEPKIEEVEAAKLPLSALYSNVVGVLAHSDFVLLDFGFAAPSYRKPYHIQDNHIARICLDWESSEYLLDSLKEMVADHKKEQESKRKHKSK